VLAGLQTVWAWRNGCADEDLPWTRQLSTSALRGRLLDALSATTLSIPPAHPHARALRCLLALCRRFLLDRTDPAAAHPAPTDKYVLFFDGGYRGNPGPGGAGAIVIRTSRQMYARDSFGVLP
jgi:hypothetical protein